MSSTVAAAQIGLQLFAKLSEADLGREKSLVAATKGARFEPIVLVDNDLTNYEGIVDVMQSLQSLFTGYLLQAIALYGNVGGTKAVRELDRFNPSREPRFGDFIRSVANLENYKHRLPTPKGSITLEAFDTNPKRVSNAYKVAIEEDGNLALTRNDEIEKSISQSANLSVGKIYNVEFTSNGQKTVVPISIRLISTIIPSERLTHILTQDALKLTDFKERYYAWRAGRISFISDLLFSRDLIKQHRKELMADKDGIYSNILRRRLKNNVASLTNSAPSLATASNMVVLSLDTVRQIEQKLNGKLSNFQTREHFFSSNGTALMIMAVVDKFADRVTFYSEGIAESTNLSLREIRTANKGAGPDVSEILKAYQLGSSPSTL